MKKKFTTINLLMSASVLFAILFQSVHSFEHVVKQFSEKHCDHNYANHKNEINHSHHGLEKCFICEFTFSPFTATENFTFLFKNPLFNSSQPYFHSWTNSEFFCGSLFAHRGPPIV